MTWTDFDPTLFEDGDILTETNILTYIGNDLLSLPHLLDLTTANNDINTTAAEQTWYSVTVPGNKLGTTGSLHVELFADILHNNAAGDTLTVRIKFGGTTQWQYNGLFGSTTNANRQPLILNFTVANKGSTSAQELFGHIQTNYVSIGAPTTGIGPALFDNTQPTPALASASGAPAVDTTVNQTLLVSVQWSASSASNSARRRWARTMLARN